MKQFNWKQFLISLAIPLGLGILSGLFTSGSMTQYENLSNIPLAPPGIVFPIVWTILYLLMGAASYLIYISDDGDKRTALKYYVAQLIVNIIWPLIFFGAEAYILAFFWLLLLWYLILQTIKLFGEINKVAAWLLVPYLVWVTFAGYLNLAAALQQITAF